MERYLIIKCEELLDQFECDANRTPLLLTNDFTPYKKFGYEVYEIEKNKKLKLIQNYDKYSWEEKR